MKFSDFLDIDPKDYKIHFTSGTRGDGVLEIFYKGEFEEYQGLQRAQNFRRKYIIGLIGDETNSEYLFVGVFKVLSVEKYDEKYTSEYSDGTGWKYSTELLSEYEHLIGRLVVKPTKPVGRMVYRDCETMFDHLEVVEYKSQKASYGRFEGFNKVNLSRSMLENIIKTNDSSWKAGLCSMKGIYLITDTNTNKLYVGSSYGDEGFWGRWSEYVSSYHGGNKAFRYLMKEEGKSAFYHFKYSILEVFDHKTSDEDIINRESDWKDRLRSKAVGYNEN